MKVCFSLDNPKREISTIRAYVMYAGKRFSFSTKESIKVNLFKNQRCKACPEAPAINNKLEAIESAIKNAIIYYKQDFKVPELGEFRNKVEQFLKGNNAIQIRKNDKAFIAYAEKYLSECSLASGTIKSYRSCIGKIKEYQEYLNKTFSFDDITLKFMESFRKWLLKQGYSRNYIGAIVKNVKVILTRAHKVDKLHENTDYQNFKVEKETADTISLSIDELIRIHRLEINKEAVIKLTKTKEDAKVNVKIKSLDIVRKKFLIGAFCAMRVSDYNRIQSYNIQGRKITIMPKKGSSIRKPVPIVIPMHWVISEILDSGFDFNCHVSEQKINKHIKEICRLAGIDDQIVYYRTEGGELKEYVCKKWEVVTTHTARRSGATNMDLAGIPIKLIMACTGHTTREQCEQYIKSSANDCYQALSKCNYFLNWQENITPHEVNVDWIRQQMEYQNIDLNKLAISLGIDQEEVKEILSKGRLTKWQKAALFYFFTKSNT